MRAQDKKPHHVVSRAVDGKPVFGTEQDRSRFIVQMFASNTGKPAFNIYRTDVSKLARNLLEGSPFPDRYIIQEHDPLVQIFSFSLAQDHYHLGVIPTTESGLSKFMQKLNIGFSKYFNMKHKRRGTLFESRFRALPIRHAKQLNEIVRHINIRGVLEAYQPNWTEEGLDDVKTALEFLHSYPFSSFQDLFQGRESHIISSTSKANLRQLLGVDYFHNTSSYLKEFNRDYQRKKAVHSKLFLE
ncbi:MAG: transposase [Candidatus Yanofskybacteria bacterium]|nr:transposase [Candidatus Yanofskybacteria bacterium]